VEFRESSTFKRVYIDDMLLSILILMNWELKVVDMMDTKSRVEIDMR